MSQVTAEWTVLVQVLEDYLDPHVSEFLVHQSTSVYDAPRVSHF